MAQASANESWPTPRPRRKRRIARTLSVFLAAGSVLGVGAAAYTRGVNGHHDTAHQDAAHQDAAHHDAAHHDAAHHDTAGPTGQARGPLAPRTSAGPTQPDTTIPPAPTDARTPAPAAKSPAKIAIGKLRINYDTNGLAQTSLPITVTNTGPVTRSFDVTVVARAQDGTELTRDLGTAADLRPGQSAQLRVMEIVNERLVEALADATFEVREIFTY